MERLLESGVQGRSNEAQLHFALGKAYEQRRDYARAFGFSQLYGEKADAAGSADNQYGLTCL